MARTGDQLLAAVKRTITIPANQVLLQDSDILALATDELLSKMVPMMVGLRQDYFLRIERQILTTGIDQYLIPYRAIGRILQDLKLFDGVQTKRMAILQTNDVHLFSYNAEPHSFYFRGDYFVVVPTPVVATVPGPPPQLPTTLQAEMWYFFRPNQIVTTSNAAQIQSQSGDTLVVSSVPPNIVIGSLVDIIQNRSGNSVLAYDCTVTNLTPTSITLSMGSLTIPVPPAPVSVVLPGDWVSLAETSPVVQLPEETFQMMTYLTCMRVLEAIGDYDGKSSINSLLTQLEKDMELLMAPRVVNEGYKVIQRNGLLRGSRTRYRRGLVY